MQGLPLKVPAQYLLAEPGLKSEEITAELFNFLFPDKLKDWETRSSRKTWSRFKGESDGK